MAEQAIALKKMTAEQRRQVEEDGYLIIRNALSDQEVEELTAEVDRLDAESQRQGRDPGSLLDVANILDTAVEELFQPDLHNPGARQVMVNAGDALAMHNGLFHCVVRNTSKTTRKNLHYTYGPQWQRAGDRMESSPELLARCNPVQKQLLGALTGPNTNGGYGAFDEGAPLVRLFEGKSFQETWDSVDVGYIRRTQA